MFVNLDGENIIGHSWESGDLKVEENDIYDLAEGVYKYKVVAGELVSLTAQEKNQSPFKN